MNHAEVAELADALDSKSSVVAPRAGSSPAFGTSKYKPFMLMTWKVFLFSPGYIYGYGKLILEKLFNRTYNLTIFNYAQTSTVASATNCGNKQYDFPHTPHPEKPRFIHNAFIA